MKSGLKDGIDYEEYDVNVVIVEDETLTNYFDKKCCKTQKGSCCKEKKGCCNENKSCCSSEKKSIKNTMLQFKK